MSLAPTVSTNQRMKRGQSKMSDTSEAMPDLEVDDEIESEMLMRIEGKLQNRSVTPEAERSSSLGFSLVSHFPSFKCSFPGPAGTPSTMLQIPLPEVRRSDAVQNVSDQKQKIRAVKGEL